MAAHRTPAVATHRTPAVATHQTPADTTSATAVSAQGEHLPFPQQHELLWAPEVKSSLPLLHALTHAESPCSDTPLPLPITGVNPKFAELPSSEIDRTKLRTIADVLWTYPALRMESKMSVLAVKLAREAFFGDSTLKRCTPRGWNDLPALPQAELNQLKTTLFAQFPRFWASPESFEQKWASAREAIAQACKRLRKLWTVYVHITFWLHVYITFRLGTVPLCCDILCLTFVHMYVVLHISLFCGQIVYIHTASQ